MEEVLPPETERGSAFEPPRVRQFTVFLENRVGRLQSLLRSLEEGEATIRALATEELADASLVRLICSDGDRARDILRANGFGFLETELIAVQFPKHNSQPLIAICSALLAAEINLRYAYPFLLGVHGPTMALYVDEPTLAAQLLLRKGFTLISDSDLKS